MGLPPPQTNHHPAATNAANAPLRTLNVLSASKTASCQLQMLSIMRKILPPHAKYQMMQGDKNVSQSISASFTSEANDAMPA
ncbi:UNVERIFIED_CONTAM: hypothetical protein Sradi_7263600 [Sesamum radiatum]|uniref:Uncharacterized protein n=1 Tax=Sesamum radiatum TaxID=300843 RepID=A0AAW2IJL1_SESRA